MAQVSHVMEVKEVMWPLVTEVKDECSAGCMPLEQR